MRVEVVEYTDPGCSWAWGTEPKFRLLRWQYGDRLNWRRVMGGLVGDQESYTPGFDPVRAAERMSGYWAEIGRTTGMTYPARLQYHYRSTEPGCRAVKAAELQGEGVAQLVLRRLRESTFVFGRPADDEDRILDAVREVPGLDVDRFEKDLRSEAVEGAFRAGWRETREPNDYVRGLEAGPPGGARFTEGHWRYVFPTLIVGDETVPGWREYGEYADAVERAAPGEPRPRPTPEELFATWPTAAPKELEVLCGEGAEPPGGIVRHDWGDGEFYMTPQEALARGV